MKDVDFEEMIRMVELRVTNFKFPSRLTKNKVLMLGYILGIMDVIYLISRRPH